MPKLTKRIIDAVEPQATEFFLWDEGIPGFGLRVMPSGRKSFVVQFRAGRRARRMSLGPCTVLTCDQARTRAITCVGRMNGSSRPFADGRVHLMPRGGSRGSGHSDIPRRGQRRPRSAWSVLHGRSGFFEVRKLLPSGLTQALQPLN